MTFKNPSSPNPANAKPSSKKPAASSLTSLMAASLGPLPGPVINEEQETARFKKLVHFVMLETIVLAVLATLLFVGTPFFLPVYQYYAMNSKAQGVQLVPLQIANMTNRAILSWATTSITEIMTIGFGDYETKLSEQRPRFTADGWDAFRNAFIKQKIGESFKQNQLVLTTVPANTPVIVAQGVNENHIYQWRVQMPVIMTYTTNNNVTRHEKAVIDLTVVRVKPDQNPSGIGIETWSLKN